ncbi:MAG: GH36 C-terminal domain-containing protein [Clostridia bacterium]
MSGCSNSARKRFCLVAMLRLESPFEGDLLAWMFVDDSRAILFHFQTESKNNGEEWKLRLKGLDQDACYEYHGRRYCGEELMKSGLKENSTGASWKNHAGIMIFFQRRSAGLAFGAAAQASVDLTREE